MTPGVVFNQLLAVKYAAIALAQSIDVLVASMTAEQEATVTPATPVPFTAAVPEEGAEDGPCTHPFARRIPLPVMGGKKFKCMDCNQDVEDTE